jgi:hypothetical protein
LQRGEVVVCRGSELGLDSGPGNCASVGIELDAQLGPRGEESPRVARTGNLFNRIQGLRLK